MKKQQGIAGILVLFIVVALVAGGAYYLDKASNKPQVTETQQPVQVTPSPDLTADWQIYKNTKHFYSIKYPRGWEIWGYFLSDRGTVIETQRGVEDFDQVYISKNPWSGEGTELYHVRYGIPEDNILISVFREEGSFTPQQYIKKFNREQEQGRASCRFGAVGSLGEELDGIFVVGLEECDLSSLGFLATHNNSIVEIRQNLFHSIYDADLPDIKIKERIFKQIVSTFRFTN